MVKTTQKSDLPWSNIFSVIVYSVLDTQKCFDTWKERLETHSEAESFFNIFLSVSKHS